jgi:hypothetical protein
MRSEANRRIHLTRWAVTALAEKHRWSDHHPGLPGPRQPQPAGDANVMLSLNVVLVVCVLLLGGCHHARLGTRGCRVPAVAQLVPTDSTAVWSLASKVYPSCCVDSVRVFSRNELPSLVSIFFTPTRLDSTTYLFQKAQIFRADPSHSLKKDSLRDGHWAIKRPYPPTAKRRFDLDGGVVFCQLSSLIEYPTALDVLRKVEHHQFSVSSRLQRPPSAPPSLRGLCGFRMSQGHYELVIDSHPELTPSEKVYSVYEFACTGDSLVLLRISGESS